MSVEVEDYYSIDFREKAGGGAADLTKAFPADHDVSVDAREWLDVHPGGSVTVNIVHQVTETLELRQNAFAGIYREN